MNKIPLVEIKPWEKNKSFRGIRHEGFDRLKDNLELGQHSTLLVMPVDGGGYISLGGNHRVPAMIEKGYTEAKCVVLTIGEDENGFYGILDGEVYRDKEGKIVRYFKSRDDCMLAYSFSHNMRGAFYLEDEVANLVGSIKDIDWSMFDGDFEEPVSFAEIEEQVKKDELFVKPEVEFTEELSEEHNYIVLYFDNDIDWLQLQTLYPLKTVKALDSKDGFEKQGVGRVVKGSDFLNKILKK